MESVDYKFCSILIHFWRFNYDKKNYALNYEESFSLLVILPTFEIGNPFDIFWNMYWWRNFKNIIDLQLWGRIRNILEE